MFDILDNYKMSIVDNIYEMSKIKCQECVKSHISEGDNYSWLELLGHGKVMKVFFEEPVGSVNGFYMTIIGGRFIVMLLIMVIIYIIVI